MTRSHKIVLQTQNAVLTTVQKNWRQKLNFFPVYVQNWQKNLFSRELWFFSKWSSVQVEWNAPLTNMPNFSSESPTLFCVKSKCYEKALTFFSGQPIFHQTLSLHLKQFFWQRCQKVLSWTWKKFILKYRIWWENLTLLEKNIKLCSRSEKRSHVNSAEPRLSLVKIISSPSPRECEILCFFSISWFLFKLILCKIESSSDKIAKNFTPNLQQFLAQISKKINRNKCPQKVRKKFYRIKMHFWQQCRKTVVRNWTIFSS